MADHSKQIRAENHALHTRSMEHPEDGTLEAHDESPDVSGQSGTDGWGAPTDWFVDDALLRGMVASICLHPTGSGDGDPSLVIAHVDNLDGFGGYPEGTSARFAHILAAAPDLLAALESLLAEVNALGWGDSLETKDAAAAIAKACG